MQKGNEKIRFRLNMQILADGLQEVWPELTFRRGADQDTLEDVCFLTEGMQVCENCVYLVREGAGGASRAGAHGAFVVAGEVPPQLVGPQDSVIQLPAQADLFRIFGRCQEIFRRNREWSEQIYEVMIRGGSVDDLCRISYPYFQNPLFVHDAQLTVISCPIWREGMIDWEEDKETGLLMAPFDLVNEFKTDKEYVHTLSVHGADIFSADLRGYRDLYVNIWNHAGGYEGRLVICELEHPLLPGQALAAEFLAGMLRILLSARSAQNPTYSYVLDQTFLDLIHREPGAARNLERRIAVNGWHVDDSYVCVRINREERDVGLTSTGNICSYIEAQVIGSKAFCDEDRICILVNLSINSGYTSDIAYVLREGLYKAGLSEVFHDLTQLAVYYRQASIALNYCISKNDTNWYRTFGSIALDYFADHCSPDFDSHYFCDAALIKLREFDARSHTELYETLRVYLLNERNTVKTSNELYIGRSTLFYRLKKITEITGLDTAHLSDPRRNLYLRLSFFIQERSG